MSRMKVVDTKLTKRARMSWATDLSEGPDADASARLSARLRDAEEWSPFRSAKRPISAFRL